MTALPPSSPGIVWRRLRPRLWVGRTDGEHLGTIERGHRFTATGTDGDPRGGYRTLQAAQASLTGEIATVAPRRRESDASSIQTALLTCSTVAMLCSVALSTVGIAILR
jgi:hypothetical protein